MLQLLLVLPYLKKHTPIISIVSEKQGHLKYRRDIIIKNSPVHWIKSALWKSPKCVFIFLILLWASENFIIAGQWSVDWLLRITVLNMPLMYQNNFYYSALYG